MKFLKAALVLITAAVSVGAQSLYFPRGWAQPFSSAEGGNPGERSSDYQEGLRALDAQDWQAAAEAFTRAAAHKGSAADGALYWKAYAESRAGEKQSALNTIAKLRRTMPESKWLRDAAALNAEMQAKNARTAALTMQSQDTDIRLLAINNLMLSKPAVAVPALKNVLSGSSPALVKDRALFVLAQSSSPEAHRVVTDVAKSGTDTNLQVRAIRYVGMLGGEDAPKQLISIYRSGDNENAKRAVLQGLAFSHSREFLLETAKTEKSPVLRAEAVRQLNMIGEGNGDDLLPLFRHEEDAQVRRAILSMLAAKGNGKALAELARSEQNAQRKAEIARYLFSLSSEEASRYAVEVLK